MKENDETVDNSLELFKTAFCEAGKKLADKAVALSPSDKALCNFVTRSPMEAFSLFHTFGKQYQNELTEHLDSPLQPSTRAGIHIATDKVIDYGLGEVGLFFNVLGAAIGLIPKESRDRSKAFMSEAFDPYIHDKGEDLVESIGLAFTRAQLSKDIADYSAMADIPESLAGIKKGIYESVLSLAEVADDKVMNFKNKLIDFVAELTPETDKSLSFEQFNKLYQTFCKQDEHEDMPPLCMLYVGKAVDERFNLSHSDEKIKLTQRDKPRQSKDANKLYPAATSLAKHKFLNLPENNSHYCHASRRGRPHSKPSDFNFKELNKKIAHAGNIATNFAILAGNEKGSSQMSALTGAAINLSLSVSLASTNPLAATSYLSSAAVGIVGCFTKTKCPTNPNAPFFKAILMLQQQMREEMHERFDAVMEGLSDIDRKLVEGLIKTHFKQYTMIEQMRLIGREIKKQTQKQTDIGITTLQHVDLLRVTMSASKIEDSIKDIKQQLTKVSRYLDAKSISKIITLFEQVGITAKRAGLTGRSLTTASVHEAIAALISPDSRVALNTLRHYVDKLGLTGDFYRSQEDVNHYLQSKTFDNINLSPVINRSQLTDRQSDLWTLVTLGSLLQQDRSKPLVIPVYAHASWELIIADEKSVHVLANKHSYVIERLKQLNITFSLVTSDHCAGYNQEAGSLVLRLHQIEQFDNHPILDKLPIDISFAQYTVLLKKYADEVEKRNLPEIMNPTLWQYLAHYLQKLFTMHCEEFSTGSSVLSGHLVSVQHWLQQGDIILSQLQRLRQSDLLTHVTTQYKKAIEELSLALVKHRQQFEKDWSAEQTLKLTKLTKERMLCERDQLLRLIDPDYAETDLPIGLEYTNYWLRGEEIEWHKKKKQTGYLGINTITRHAKSARDSYIAARRASIKQKIHQVRDEINTKIDDPSWQVMVELNHFSDLQVRPCLPIIMKPSDEKSNYPDLPLPATVAEQLDPEIFQAHALGIIDIAVKYYTIPGLEDLSPSKVYIDIKVALKDKTDSKSHKITLFTRFEPLFYEGAEAIWWPWMGGNYALNTDLTANSTSWPGNGRVSYHATWWVPKTSEQKGLYEAVVSGELTLNRIRYSAYRELRTLLNPLIKEKLAELRGQWQKEVVNIARCDQTSPLGTAIKRAQECYHLLKLYSDLTLADKGQLCPLKSFQRNEVCPLSPQEIIQLGIQDNPVDIVEALPKDEQVSDLETNLHRRRIMVSESGRYHRFYFDDIAQALEQLLDTYMPFAHPSISGEIRLKLHNKIFERLETNLFSLAQQLPAEMLTDPGIREVMSLVSLGRKITSAPETLAAHEVDLKKLTAGTTETMHGMSDKESEDNPVNPHAFFSGCSDDHAEKSGSEKKHRYK